MTKILLLFSCKRCGFISIHNFRDDSCPVCHVCNKVSMMIINVNDIEIKDAPHTEDEDIT